MNGRAGALKSWLLGVGLLLAPTAHALVGSAESRLEVPSRVEPGMASEDDDEEAAATLADPSLARDDHFDAGLLEDVRRLASDS